MVHEPLAPVLAVGGLSVGPIYFLVEASACISTRRDCLDGGHGGVVFLYISGGRVGCLAINSKSRQPCVSADEVSVVARDDF